MAIISNAQFKPIIGAEAKVNATPKKQGNLLVATDTGKMFVDVDDTTRHEIGGAGGSVSPFHQHTGADGTGKVSYSDLLNVPAAFVPSAHPHATGDISGLDAALAARLTVSGGAMTGALTADNDTNYTTSKVRNIYATTSDLTPGSSALANGTICLVYE